MLATFSEQQEDRDEVGPEGKGHRCLGKGLPCRDVGLWALCQPRLPLPLTTRSAFSWDGFEGSNPLPWALEQARSSWRQAGPCLPWQSPLLPALRLLLQNRCKAGPDRHGPQTLSVPPRLFIALQESPDRGMELGHSGCRISSSIKPSISNIWDPSSQPWVPLENTQTRNPILGTHRGCSQV